MRRTKPLRDLPAKRSEIFDFLTQYYESCLSPAVPAKKPDTSFQDSYQSTSAESNKQPSCAYSLLREDESKFLEYYGVEQFQDMLRQEWKCQFPNLMETQQDITRHLRASVIDWLFEVGTKLQIEDKGVIF